MPKPPHSSPPAIFHHIPPTCTVGWHAELATPGEAGLEGAALALRDQLLHGEEEGHLGAVAPRCQVDGPEMEEAGPSSDDTSLWGM